MILDEQELHQNLEAAAAYANTPSFEIEAVIKRIRRRRATIIGLISGSLLAVAAAIALIIPIGLGGVSGPPAAPRVLPFRLSYTATVNGRSLEFPKNGSPANFIVTAGRNLRISIGVTVPVHAKVTGLWLGVVRNAFGSNRDGRPTGMRPILGHSHKPLTPGLHMFRLRWTVPSGLRRGTTLHLAATWTARQARVGQVIVKIVVIDKHGNV